MATYLQVFGKRSSRCLIRMIPMLLGRLCTLLSNRSSLMSYGSSVRKLCISKVGWLERFTWSLIIFVFPQHLTQMLAQSWWPMNMSCWPCCGEGDWPPWGEQQLRVQARGQNARVSSRDQLRDPDQNQPL